MKTDIVEIKKLLADDAFAFCEWLFPNGRNFRNEFCVGDLDGSAGESLKICINGAKVGVWEDFETNEKGDNLIELLAQARHGGEFIPALKDSEAWLANNAFPLQSNAETFSKERKEIFAKKAVSEKRRKRDKRRAV